MNPERTSDNFQAGLDDADFGRQRPKPPNSSLATDAEQAAYEERAEAYDSRADLDEDGEYRDDA